MSILTAPASRSSSAPPDPPEHSVDLLGTSHAMRSVLGEANVVARLDVNVFLGGETGTGKTLLARAMHEASRRAAGPFVELNCATLPADLIESELFGAEAGAHSTARRRTSGKIDAASGGTLLLDDVGELPLSVQAKLLQVVQSRTYFPLGSARRITADVRLITATHRDLAEAVRSGTFREDLRFRLEVMTIRLPPLRERSDDIPELAHFFAGAAAARHGLAVEGIRPDAMEALSAHLWPGNVRELEHRVESGVIRAACDDARLVGPRHVFPHQPSAPSPDESFRDATRRFQADLLRRTLDACDGSVTRAAQQLGMSRSHFYQLRSELGLNEKRESAGHAESHEARGEEWTRGRRA